MHNIICILYFPLSWLIWTCFYLCKYRDRIQADYLAFERVNNPKNAAIIKDCRNVSFWSVYSKFMSYKEFRSLFWFRVGRYSKLVRFLFPSGQIELGFDVRRENVGGGLYLQHGYCTDLSAKSIGTNCWINQKVTLGYKGAECPTLGNNVRIGVGANIIGGVKIGDNAVIGAGTTVVKDVPSNTLVVGQVPRYIDILEIKK